MLTKTVSRLGVGNPQDSLTRAGTGPCVLHASAAPRLVSHRTEPRLQERLSQLGATQEPAGSSCCCGPWLRHPPSLAFIWKSSKKFSWEPPLGTDFFLVGNHILAQMTNREGFSPRTASALPRAAHQGKISLGSAQCAWTWGTQLLKGRKIYLLSMLLLLFHLIKAVVLLGHLLSGLSHWDPKRTLCWLSHLATTTPPTHNNNQYR